MAIAITRENYLLHKLHSLSGIVPVGFYMVQHLTLNTFTLGGPEYFNRVIGFFEAMPKHLLLGLEVVAIWIPLLFHAVYGLFIANRAQPNSIGTKYGWTENRMFTAQRWTGIFLFIFLAIHVSTTTIAKYAAGNAEPIMFDAMQAKLIANGYAMFVLYLFGILAASYHLSYGVWNFAIRWGISISEQAQAKVQKFALGMFIVVTALGWAALAGFLMHKPTVTAFLHSVRWS